MLVKLNNNIPSQYQASLVSVQKSRRKVETRAEVQTKSYTRRRVEVQTSIDVPLSFSPSLSLSLLGVVKYVNYLYLMKLHKTAQSNAVVVILSF